MSQKALRPYDVPHLRKLGIFSIVLTILFVTFIGTATHPELTGKIGSTIFMSILGATMFTFFLMFAREKKQWEKSLGK